MAVTQVSVPGKLILMGEHAVVYGRPALIAAVGLRLRARIKDTTGSGVHLSLPLLGVDETVSWEAIQELTAGARERWERFREVPTAARFQEIRGQDPAHLVKMALGEAAWSGEGEEFDEADPEREGGLQLSIESAIPIGSGFGSSAAASVAIAAAYRRHRGRTHDLETLDRIALNVERRQHGLPSGADHATVLRGGVLWARREDEKLLLRPLNLPPGPLSRLQVFDSGPPVESTGEIVAAVAGRRAEDRARHYAILDRMERAAEAFRDQLLRDSENPPVMVAILREYESCLEELDVVPEPVRAILRRIEDAGGAGKISGAGSLTGEGAGGVIVYHPAPGAGPEGSAAAAAAMADLRPHEVSLGVPGLSWEEG